MVKFSVYFNRRVFVMAQPVSGRSVVASVGMGGGGGGGGGGR